MMARNSHGRSFKEHGVGPSTLLLWHISEPRQTVRIYNRRVEPGLGAIVEENTVDDLTSRGEPDTDPRDAGDSLDILDLLLDETD